MSGTANFHHAIGPALFYKLDPSFMTPWIGEQWYWKYHDSGKTNGPFSTQEECERHAKGCIAASGRGENQNNVIYVDFVGKTYLKDGKYTHTKKTLNAFKGRYFPGGVS